MKPCIFCMMCFPVKYLFGSLFLSWLLYRYPNPSAFTYEKRLFRPFEDALQAPPWYKEDHVAVNKPELPNDASELKQYDGPQCFVIPGNHGWSWFSTSASSSSSSSFFFFKKYLLPLSNPPEKRNFFFLYDDTLFYITDWFDGLHTFMRYICKKSWLGGWCMPQKNSYFALQLPRRWWVFGLDLTLHGDINVYQFKFFSELVKDKVLSCYFFRHLYMVLFKI